MLCGRISKYARRHYSSTRQKRHFSKKSRKTSFLTSLRLKIPSRNKLYVIGGGIFIVGSVFLEIGAMYSTDSLEETVLELLDIEEPKKEELEKFVQQLGTILANFKNIKRLKNGKKVCDILIHIIEYEAIDDRSKSMALHVLYLLCKYNDELNTYTIGKIDLKNLYDLFKMHEDNIKNQSSDYIETPSDNIKKNYLLLMTRFSESVEEHKKLIQGGILDLCWLLSNKDEDDYIYAVHILKYLAQSEVGSQYILESDMLQHVFEKVYPSKKLPKWISYGVFPTEMSFLKVNDFLIKMLKNKPDEIAEKYPYMIPKLNELSKANSSYESSRSMFIVLNQIKTVSITFFIGIVYGGIRRFISLSGTNYSPRVIITRGSIPAALAGSTTIGLKNLYDHYYEDIWKDEHLFLLQKLVFSALSVSYFYVLGRYINFYIVPVILATSFQNNKDEFDTREMKSQKKYLRRWQSRDERLR